MSKCGDCGKETNNLFETKVKIGDKEVVFELCEECLIELMSTLGKSQTTGDDE